jgi:hypothetical protein
MAKNKLVRLLNDPTKGMNETFGTNGILAHLFRKMLHDLNVSPMRWGSLMYDFITDPRNGVPDNKKDQTSWRGNFVKEFERRQMTWKVFCKAMRFLQLVKIRFIVEAYHRNGKVTEHSTFVNFGVVEEQDGQEPPAEPEHSPYDEEEGLDADDAPNANQLDLFKEAPEGKQEDAK